MDLAKEENVRGQSVTALSVLMDSSVPTEGATLLDFSAAGEPLGGAEPDVGAGRYRLMRLLGEGGMGSVYEAEQLHPVRRRVAVKLIKLGMDTRQVVARFAAERQVLAMMDHPGIAKVFDAGATAQGRPFFVMELVEGMPITRYCDEYRLTIRQRLELFAEVCDAVQHAHQKGVIHRDIKPSNVLVALHDGKPAARIIDFGIAKATAGNLGLTVAPETQAFLGTPEYASPEQVSGDFARIDTRTDVYALGTMLYELLTGLGPFLSRPAGSSEQLLSIRRSGEPPRPSVRLASASGEDETTEELARRRGVPPGMLMRLLRRDLEWIPLKAMRVDPDHRYASAAELAQDIRHYLVDEPILARPPSRIYHLRMFARRNRLAVTALAAVALMMLTAIVGITWGLVEANSARTVAEREAGRAQRTNRFMEDMLSLPDPYLFAGGAEVTVVQLLDEAVKRIPDGFGDDPLAEADLRRTVAQTYRNVGRYREAEEQCLLSLALNRQYRGENAPETLRASLLLGGLYTDQERFEESEAILRRTLALQELVNGPDHPDTLSTQAALAWTFFLTERASEAEQLIRPLLERRRRLFGENDPATIKTMTNLAVMLVRQGALNEESRQLAEQGASGLSRLLGAEHPDTIYARHIVAWWHWKDGQLAEALELYLPVLETAKRTLGEAHPHTLFWSINVVQLLTEMQRHDEAEELAEGLLSATRRIYGQDHERVDSLREQIAIARQPGAGDRR